MNGLDAIVAEWCARDHERALLPMDHEIIESTRAARALILELLHGRARDRDLFHACAMLGRLIAERGGSPTLAVSTLDSARECAADLEPALVESARAAVAEGYVQTRLDASNAESAARWEYPRCVVPLDRSAIAIAAGYPDDDGEALAAWAARIANAAARAGARRAVLAGGDAARRALVDALSLVGIEVRS